MEYWAELEADLLQYFQIGEPLALTWRKFLIVVTALPGDSRLMTALRQDSPEYRMAQLRKKTGTDRSNVDSVRTVGAREFLEGI